MAKRALIVEGGGMRGAYAAGVLMGLKKAGREYDAIYASSSGACSAAYLAAGQEEGLSIWEKHLHGNRLLSATNFARGKPYLDLDYLIDEVFAKRVPLDIDALRASAAPVWITVTRARDGVVEYRDLRQESDPLHVLRATAALPIAYGKAVKLGGESYLDGGMGDPIPVVRALSEGATHITAVLTKPLGYRRPASPAWLTWFGSLPYPGASPAFATLHERYNEALANLERPPPFVQVKIITPPPKLALGRLTRNKRDLRRAVKQGLADATV